MNLPLPEKKTILVAIAGSPAYFSGYSTEQIQAYGQACREAALAELHVPEISCGNIVEPVAWAITASNTGRMCQVTLDHDEVEGMNSKYVTPLYLHPPQPTTVKQYLKVGDSRFESWYSELNQAGKGSKQIAREAYEAGLNEADAQQAKPTDWSAA